MLNFQFFRSKCSICTTWHFTQSLENYWRGARRQYILFEIWLWPHKALTPPQSVIPSLSPVHSGLVQCDFSLVWKPFHNVGRSINDQWVPSPPYSLPPYSVSLIISQHTMLSWPTYCRDGGVSRKSFGFVGCAKITKPLHFRAAVSVACL